MLIFRVCSSKHAVGGAILSDVKRHCTTEEEETRGRSERIINIADKNIDKMSSQQMYLLIISKWRDFSVCEVELNISPEATSEVVKSWVISLPSHLWQVDMWLRKQNIVLTEALRNVYHDVYSTGAVQPQHRRKTDWLSVIFVRWTWFGLPARLLCTSILGAEACWTMWTRPRLGTIACYLDCFEQTETPM